MHTLGLSIVSTGTTCVTHRLPALVAAALCLSLAGATIVLFLRHHRPESHNVDRRASRESHADLPFFGPAIQVVHCRPLPGLCRHGALVP